MPGWRPCRACSREVKLSGLEHAQGRSELQQRRRSTAAINEPLACLCLSLPLQKHRIGLKGPMTTPIGKGFRSLNLTLRKVS